MVLGQEKRLVGFGIGKIIHERFLTSSADTGPQQNLTRFQLAQYRNRRETTADPKNKAAEVKMSASAAPRPNALTIAVTAINEAPLTTAMCLKKSTCAFQCSRPPSMNSC